MMIDYPGYNLQASPGVHATSNLENDRTSAAGGELICIVGSISIPIQFD